MHARRLYLFEYASLKTVCFFSCLFRFEVFFVRMWRRPCFVRMSFPVPVFLKRFRIAFLVFILLTIHLRSYFTFSCPMGRAPNYSFVPSASVGTRSAQYRSNPRQSADRLFVQAQDGPFLYRGTCKSHVLCSLSR